ncbi:hypothetical protein JW766_00865 [Candidatus Dojkabacteria bacterium]|nr:hypothetical protein [Candidatus Dojkabacteria bacterium]
MVKQSQKDLLLVLGLTVVFGLIVYLLAQLVDNTVAEVTSTRNQIRELTRISGEDVSSEEEPLSTEEYKDLLDKNLPDISGIIEILDQLEVIAQITNVDLSIKLEEGIVGESDIEFKDTKERNTFLSTIEVKEYKFEDQPQVAAPEGSENVVLQMMEEGGQTQEEPSLKINYLEVDLNVKGTYNAIRTYISLLRNSKYIFNIKEIRLNRTENGELDGSIKVRVFIFEKK